MVPKASRSGEEMFSGSHRFFFGYLYYGFSLEHILLKFNNELRFGTNEDQGDSCSVDLKEKEGMLLRQSKVMRRIFYLQSLPVS